MQFLRNKNFALVIVIIVIVGLVFAYVPLLFTPRETAQPGGEETRPLVNTTASLTPIQENQATTTETEEQPVTEPQSAVSSSQPIELEGLKGFGDEQDALDELDQLFE